MNEKKKKITFVLPGFISIPMGGVKVVNRLAELLSKRNFEVTLVYPKQIELGIVQKFKGIIKTYLDKKNNVQEKLYYEPGVKVNRIVVKEISEKYIPNSNYIVAVGWQTANLVFSLSLQKGEKYYFLQSYEAYFSSYQKVRETYKLNMKKIAISNWVVKEMIKLGKKSLGPVGNSINSAEFFIEENIKRTNDVLMLYHPARIKNCVFGLKVLQKIKKRDTNFSAMIFSARQPVHKIPEWIKVVIRPDIHTLRRMYNMSKIFFNTSKWEGWGLTPMEAMACGSAVVAVKNQGITEFLKNDVNSYIIAPKNKSQAIEKIRNLLKDTNKREKFITESYKTLEKFSEYEVTTKFENCLNDKG